MILTTAELVRVLEYVPKETSADLHEKILGLLVQSRFTDILQKNFYSSKEDRVAAEGAFIRELTEVELVAWHTYVYLKSKKDKEDASVR